MHNIVFFRPNKNNTEAIKQIRSKNSFKKSYKLYLERDGDIGDVISGLTNLTEKQQASYVPTNIIERPMYHRNALISYDRLIYRSGLTGPNIDKCFIYN